MFSCTIPFTRAGCAPGAGRVTRYSLKTHTGTLWGADSNLQLTGSISVLSLTRPRAPEAVGDDTVCVEVERDVCTVHVILQTQLSAEQEVTLFRSPECNPTHFKSKESKMPGANLHPPLPYPLPYIQFYFFKA